MEIEYLIGLSRIPMLFKIKSKTVNNSKRKKMKNFDVHEYDLARRLIFSRKIDWAESVSNFYANHLGVGISK